MGESLKLWRCTNCNRVLRERDVAYARARHQAMVHEASPASAAEFVEEATWGAYLASLRRCRCGSRKRLAPVNKQSLRGQLDLSLAFDLLVLQ
jgi:hypothetical protein